MHLVKSVLCVFLLFATVALAHDFPCGHNHIEDESGEVFLESLCNDEPGACDFDLFE